MVTPEHPVAAHVGAADRADLFALKVSKPYLHKAIVVSDAAFAKLVEARSDVVRLVVHGGADLAQQCSVLDFVKEFRANVTFIGLGQNTRGGNHIQKTKT